MLHHYLRLGADLDFSQHPVMAWAPDAKPIIYSGLGAVGSNYRLYALNVNTGEVHPVTTPGNTDVGDSSPAISSDGRYLAFVRYLAPRNGHLMIQPLQSGVVPSGEPQMVQGSSQDPHSPIWLEDDKELLFADYGQFYEWSRNKGTVSIYQATGLLGGAAMGPKKIGGEQVVVAVQKHDPEIYAIPLDDRGIHPIGPAQIMRNSTEENTHPEYSPDGCLMKFISDTSGSAQVLKSNADGSHRRQLTHINAYLATYPKCHHTDEDCLSRAHADVSEVL